MNLRSEARHVAEQGRSLIRHAADAVDAREQVAEARRAEQDLDRRGARARGVDANRLQREIRLRLLQVAPRDAELELPARKVALDAVQLDVREIPALDRRADLRVERVYLRDDLPSLRLLRGDARICRRAARDCESDRKRCNASPKLSDVKLDGGSRVGRVVRTAAEARTSRSSRVTPSKHICGRKRVRAKAKPGSKRHGSRDFGAALLGSHASCGGVLDSRTALSSSPS
jgi:hypothetical protein